MSIIPTAIEESEYIEIAEKPFSGVTFRVSDEEVEDIGITKIFAVTLLSDDMGNWVASGSDKSDVVSLERLDTEGSESVKRSSFESASKPS